MLPQTEDECNIKHHRGDASSSLSFPTVSYNLVIVYSIIWVLKSNYNKKPIYIDSDGLCICVVTAIMVFYCRLLLIFTSVLLCNVVSCLKCIIPLPLCDVWFWIIHTFQIGLHRYLFKHSWPVLLTLMLPLHRQKMRTPWSIPKEMLPVPSVLPLYVIS